MNAQIFGTPPTDNIYKFLAISGLILLILSFGYPKKLIYEAEIQVIDLKAEKVKFDIKMNYLSVQLDYAKKEIDLGIKDLAYSPQDLRKSLVDQQILQSELEQSENKINALKSQIEEIRCYSYIGMVIGFLFVIIGFLLWYIRVQNPADKKALKELEVNSATTLPAPPASSA